MACREFGLRDEDSFAHSDEDLTARSDLTSAALSEEKSVVHFDDNFAVLVQNTARPVDHHSLLDFLRVELLGEDTAAHLVDFALGASAHCCWKSARLGWRSNVPYC